VTLTQLATGLSLRNLADVWAGPCRTAKGCKLTFGYCIEGVIQGPKGQNDRRQAARCWYPSGWLPRQLRQWEW